MHQLSNIIGLIGVCFVLVAYFLSQAGIWASDDTLFLFGNLLGSLCVIVSLVYNWNISSFIIEVAWTIITIYGMVKKSIKKKNENSYVMSKS
jgi:hypothetical protein